MQTSNTIVVSLQARIPRHLARRVTSTTTEPFIIENTPGITRAFRTGILRFFRTHTFIKVSPPVEFLQLNNVLRFSDGVFFLLKNDLFSPPGASDLLVCFHITLNTPITQEAAELLTTQLFGYGRAREQFFAQLFVSTTSTERQLLTSAYDIGLASLIYDSSFLPFPPSGISIIHTYVIFGGMILSRLEHELNTMDLQTENIAYITRTQNALTQITQQTTEFRRLFMTKNQAITLPLTRFIENIHTIHFIRERFDDQLELLAEIDALLRVSIDKRRLTIFQDIRNVSFVLGFILTPLSLFFGLFSVSLHSDVIVDGLAIIKNDVIIVLLLLSFGIPIALLLSAAGARALWRSLWRMKS